MDTTTITMFNSTLKYANKHIFIKPLCDFFGINYENQCRAITKDTLLSKEFSKIADPEIFGDKRERFALSKKGFLRWIQRLNPQIVKKELEEKFIEYQDLIFDFLFGSVERDESFKANYSRLSRLKKLKSKIENEIKTCEKEIKYYLEYRYQGKLDLNTGQKAIK